MGRGKRVLGVRIEVVGGEVGGVWKVSMKIITYNARGLGGGDKRVEVRRLVHEKRPMVLCIQETKLGMINDQWVKALWGEGMHNFSYQPSVGASGGMVTVWDVSRIDVWTSFSFNHVLAIKGKVILTGEELLSSMCTRHATWQLKRYCGSVCLCVLLIIVTCAFVSVGILILICLSVEDCLLGFEVTDFL